MPVELSALFERESRARSSVDRAADFGLSRPMRCGQSVGGGAWRAELSALFQLLRMSRILEGRTAAPLRTLRAARRVTAARNGARSRRSIQHRTRREARQLVRPLPSDAGKVRRDSGGFRMLVARRAHLITRSGNYG